jgi:hypothetical protein
MQAVAREVGVDPELVARAAGLLPSDTPPALRRLLGGRLRLDATYHAPIEGTSEQLSDVVRVLRAATGSEGVVQQELDTTLWRTVSEVAHTRVALRPDPDGTGVTVSVDLRAASSLTWTLTTLLFLFLAAATGDLLAPAGALGTLLWVVGFLAAGLLSSRALWSTLSGRAEARLMRLMDVLAAETGVGRLPADEEPAPGE